MLLDWTARYVGLRYDHTNCWQLTRRVMMEEFGVFLPSYADEPVDLALEKGRQHFKSVDRPEAGDLVLMQRMGLPHIGVMLDSERMLHTSRGKNAVVERISRFRHQVTGYYRI